MSTQSRSKNRNSRRQSTSNKQSAFGKETVAKHGIGFVPFVLGTTTGFSLLLIILGLIVKPPVNPEILSASEKDIGEVVTKVEKQDFKTFLANANTEKLVETLHGLVQIQPRFGTPSHRSVTRRRIAVSDKLMTHKLTDQQRRDVVSAKIRTLADLFWANRQANKIDAPDIMLDLRESTEKFCNDSDLVLARLARIQLALLNALTADQRVDAYARELHGLLVDFPDDSLVASTVLKCLDHHLSAPESIPTASKLAELILELPRPKSTGRSSAATGTSPWVSIADLWLLCDRGFFELFNTREFSGPIEREQLVSVCLELLREPAAHDETRLQVYKAANWLERSNRYTQAKTIYAEFLAIVDSIDSPQQRALALARGEKGLKRCEAIGKKFEIDGRSIVTGQPINLKKYQGLPVLLVYWSSSDPVAQNRLQAIEQAADRWRSRAVKVLAVQLEEDTQQYGNTIAQEFAQKYSDWEFCQPNADGSHPVFDQLPLLQRHGIAILNRDHELVDSAIAVEDLPTIVNATLVIPR